jgi:hypothetical protein
MRSNLTLVENMEKYENMIKLWKSHNVMEQMPF